MKEIADMLIGIALVVLLAIRAGFALGIIRPNEFPPRTPAGRE